MRPTPTTAMSASTSALRTFLQQHSSSALPASIASTSTSSHTRQAVSQTTRYQSMRTYFPRRTISSTASRPSAQVARRSISTSPASAAKPASVSAPSSQAEEAAQTPASWTPHSQRVGLMGVKMGMISYFLPNGQCVPCTVVQVQHNQVMRHVHFDPLSLENQNSVRPPTSSIAAPNSLSTGAASTKPYTALQVYAGPLPPAQARRTHNTFTRGGLVREFRISEDARVPVNTVLSASHFVPGQQVDVQGVTKGKGFQGAMKRHGFKGLRASHGVSISHRSHGSTGQHQDPGRVFPGKKMAGRMGGRNSTLHNLTVLRIDLSKSLIFIKGNLPGPIGSLLKLTDAQRSLTGKARVAAWTGRLRDGSLAKGDEPPAAYLPPGLVNLPFPAATKEMEKSLPAIIEVSSL